MSIEHKVAADDLRSHKKLCDDVQVMAAKVAIFDELVGALDRCSDLLADHTSCYYCQEFFDLTIKAKELQK